MPDDDDERIVDVRDVAGERPTLSMAPLRPESESDVYPTIEQRRHEAEMRMLRSADAQQSQILSAVMDMVTRLESRQAESETRIHERLDIVHKDLEEIKLALYAYRKD